MPQRSLFALALFFSLVTHTLAALYWRHATGSTAGGDRGSVTLRVRVARPARAPVAARVEQKAPPVKAVRKKRPAVRKKPRPRPPAEVPRPVQPGPEPPREQPRQTAVAALTAAPPAPAGEGRPRRAPAMARKGLAENYLGRVVARIEAFRKYPVTARRRRLEGRVDVDLAIDCSGRVASLQTHGGPVLLRKAAAASVRRAQPLPPPPSGCPRTVRYTMVYRLHPTADR